MSPALLARFRRECQQQTAYLVRVACAESGASPQSFLWDRPSLTVGRGPDCDLILNHAEISRHHAYLQVLGERIYCADLGSRTGTHWAHGATQSGWVQPDELVSLGPYSLSFESAPSLRVTEDPVDDSAPVAAPAPEEIFLDFLNAGRNVRRYRVAREIVLIGSGDAAKIHLTHASVSKVHCAVVRTPHGLWVVDLLSEDGTLVNGHVVPLARLTAGDEFQVGRFLVAVQYQTGGANGSSDSHGRPVVREADRSGVNESAASSGRYAVPVPAADGETSSALRQLARAVSGNAASSNPSGFSEQFVLNVIRELGVMQQQALQHATDSMQQAVHQLASNYQSRIDSLEREHRALRRQLPELPDYSSPPGYGVAPPDESSFGPVPGRWDGPSPVGPGPMWDDLSPGSPEAAPIAEPGHGSLGCPDPAQRELWVREQMKAIEKELEKTRRGWGQRLIDLLGY